MLLSDSGLAGGTLSIIGVTSPTSPGGASVTLASGAITYTPKAGFTGADTINYTLSDGCAATTLGGIGVTVAPSGAPSRPT